MSHDIDVAFFDWGGVLAEEGFVKGLRAIATTNGLDADEFFADMVKVVYDTGYVYGRCDEERFWIAVGQKLHLEHGNRATWRADILERFAPRPWMFDVVERLKASGVRVAVLSDQVNWLDELEETFGFAHRFEKVFNSYYYGWTKSEPEFFQLALKEMGGVAPEKALLIDDAQRNIAMARQVGLKAIYYEDRLSCMRELSLAFPGIFND